MAGRAQPSDSYTYSEDGQQYRSLRAVQDQPQKEFNDDLYHFPNLFSLKSELQGHEKIKDLLSKQEEERNEGRLQDDLEKVRCHNLIIFCKFCLGRKQEALQDCEAVETDASKSIIFLTLKAMLQFEFGHRQECSATMRVLKDMYKLPDFGCFCAVAESEKGYLLNCIGPRGFARAVDLFEKAISAFPDRENYLWKYDLALVIRRNFSIYAHCELSDFRPSELARRAYKLLKDIVDNCQNDVYRGRAMVELARLVSHLRTFCSVCKENEGEKIRSLCEDCDENIYFEKALDTKAGQEDFYILRECGRHFQYVKKLKRAVSCLESSYQKRKNALVCQVLGKTYLSMYKAGEHHFSPWILEEVPGLHQSPTETKDSTTTHIQGVRDSSTVLATENPVQHSRSDDETLLRKLAADFDKDIFLDEEGEFRTTQPEGIVGNFWVQQSSESENKPVFKNPVQHSRSDDETLRRKLEAEFEEGNFLDEEGEFRTTQPEGVVGNLRVQQSSESENKPVFKTSQSCPPSATFPERRGSHECRTSPLSPEDSRTQERVCAFRRTSYPPRRGLGSPRRVDGPHRTRPVNTSSLLKSKLKDLSYDASDHRIKAAEYFYCKGCILNPYNANLLFDTGTLFEGMGNLEKAVQYYQKVVALQNLCSGINLVNAYERIGICLMKQLQTCQQESERAMIKARVEDMFMQSLIECSRAVVYLPKVSAKRTQLWESYPRLLEILHQQEQGTASKQKEAKAHELAGNHLKAVSVYQEVMRLAKTDEDRIQALLGTVSNYCSIGRIKDARYILDLFLTVKEERHWMLTNKDDQTKSLRETAVRIYTKSGREALKARQIPDARRAFNTALLMKGRVLDTDTDPRQTGAFAPDTAGLSQAPNMQEQFDLSIFYDEKGQELLEDVAECMASASRQYFGIRVSVNNEDGALGQLDFESELQVAGSTHLVILVVDSTVAELHPRMSCLADRALTHARDTSCVMLFSIGSASTPLPVLVRGLCSFSDIPALLTLKDGEINESAICDLFSFLLGD